MLYSESVGSSFGLRRPESCRCCALRRCFHADACVGAEAEEVRHIVSLTPTPRPLRYCLSLMYTSIPILAGRWRRRYGLGRCLRIEHEFGRSTSQRALALCPPDPNCDRDKAGSLLCHLPHLSHMHRTSLSPVMLFHCHRHRRLPRVLQRQNGLLIFAQMVDGLCHVLRIVGGVDGTDDIWYATSSRALVCCVANRALSAASPLSRATTLYGDVLWKYRSNFILCYWCEYTTSCPPKWFILTISPATKYYPNIIRRHRPISRAGMVSLQLLPHGLHRPSICS